MWRRPILTARSSATGPGKRFYVSPFMDMDMRYRFVVASPGDRLGIKIEVDDAEGSRMTAAFTARRAPLTDRALLSAWISHPLQSLMVVGGIHWEALRLWIKGVGFRPRPRPPEAAVTLCGPTVS